MYVDLHASGGRGLRLLATDMENAREHSMKLHDWEQIIQQMMAESHHEPKESGKSKVLMEWRAKLAKAPHLLQPFQIDEIVRELRKRLTSASVQRNLRCSGSAHPLVLTRITLRTHPTPPQAPGPRCEPPGSAPLCPHRSARSRRRCSIAPFPAVAFTEVRWQVCNGRGFRFPPVVQCSTRRR